MSNLYAPIDEKWLDRPRAKRGVSESEPAKPRKKRRRIGKKDESSSDEDLDLLVELRKTEHQKEGAEDNKGGDEDDDEQDVSPSSKEKARSSNRGDISTKSEKKSDPNNRRSDPEPSTVPTKKIPKTAAFTQQTDLLSFFGSSGPSKSSKSKPSFQSPDKESKAKENKEVTTPKESERSKDTTIPGPMIPIAVPPPRNVAWNSVKENVIVRKVANDKPRDKVAAFDLDGTLTIWRTGGWPSKLEHYELWSSTVPAKLRAYYDEGFKLVFFTNQGGIQSAHNGKKATLVKRVINWIAQLVDRPIHAVLSTRSLKKDPGSFHKPTGKMWSVATKFLNKGQPFNVGESFFVGDSADISDEQGGVDLRFAQAVSNEHGDGVELKFYSPTEHFGPSDFERRSRPNSVSPPPKEALAARAGLLGGYYIEGPIMLLLCGVQGSGKSTFCSLLADTKNKHWVHLSQDTINDGKPGRREKVEAEAILALQEGKSVLIDRMHLDPAQRDYFISIAKSINVPTHVLVFNPAREVISKRVRERKDHPGKVMGDQGVRVAMQSLDRLAMPKYDEGFQLITCVSTPARVAWLASQYKALEKGCDLTEPAGVVPLSDSLNIPAISMGTMGIGKKKACEVVRSILSAGISSIDTAPTYKNEEQVGDALSTKHEVFCIAKIPKSAVLAEHVRPELESTLKKLQRKHVDILLLHWPCDVVVAGTLAEVWKEMEKCLEDGLCKTLGVCNFNPESLVKLLANCSVRPVVNQVERHPLLAQWDLIDYCERNGIAIQAHSPLGQGKHELLENEVIKKVAADTSMSPAQVAIRWNLQHGVLVTPKCTVPEHALELLNCKALDANHMKSLDSLDRGKRFVAPPFMYGKQDFCWGDRYPRK